MGVDGCKTGWVAVALADQLPPEAHYLPTIDAVRPLADRAEAVAVDISIGLPPSGARAADIQARGFLGARSARRVARGQARSFPDPPAVDEKTGRPVAIWA